MEQFKEKVLGIKRSFEWSIEEKKKLGEDTEMEEVCLADTETVLRYISMYERKLI